MPEIIIVSLVQSPIIGADSITSSNINLKMCDNDDLETDG